MRLFLRTIFFPAAAARIFCRTPHKSRRTNSRVLFYHRFISAGLVGQHRWGLFCLVSLLASLGTHAQSSTTICTSNSVDLSSVVSVPVGSTLSFSKQPPAIAIAAGTYHSIAVLADGSTTGWGQDDHNETYIYSRDRIIAIAAGDSYSCFDASLSSVNGRSVQNSLWSFSGANPSYYILTTSQPISPGGKLSFGLSGSLRPGLHPMRGRPCGLIQVPLGLSYSTSNRNSG